MVLSKAAVWETSSIPQVTTSLLTQHSCSHRHQPCHSHCLSVWSFVSLSFCKALTFFLSQVMSPLWQSFPATWFNMTAKSYKIILKLLFLSLSILKSFQREKKVTSILTWMTALYKISCVRHVTFLCASRAALCYCCQHNPALRLWFT